MGSICEDLATSNNEPVARSDRCVELEIPCEYKISPDQRFKPLGCENCTKEQHFCVFSYPIIGKPPLPLSKLCSECQCAHRDVYLKIHRMIVVKDVRRKVPFAYLLH